MRKRSRKQKSEIEETTASGIMAAATQDIELTAEQIADATKKVAHAAAVALEKLGGLKGGKAKAAKSAKKPAQTAKKTARARRSRSTGKPIKR